VSHTATIHDVFVHISKLYVHVIFFHTGFYTPKNIKLAGDLEGIRLGRKLVLLTFLAILLTNLLGMAIEVEKVKASGTIYIRADGSIDPLTASITSADNVTYIFTDNIYDEIVVERDNILLDGQGYILQGSGDGTGITLSGRSNVTLRNIVIIAFHYGVRLSSSSNYNTVSGNNIASNIFYGVVISSSSYNNTVSGNHITSNGFGGVILSYSSNNTVSGNNITNNYEGVELDSSSNNTVSGNNITNNSDGVWLYSSSNYNTVSGNYITNNGYGVFLDSSSNNTVSGNNITNSDQYGVCLSMHSTSNIVSENNIANNYAGVGLDFSSSNTVSGNNITDNNLYAFWLGSSSFNIIYHNNFVANNLRILLIDSINNTWDNGCEGNFWSDFTGSDSNGDGIGDTPYIIDGSNQDSYPLMNPYWNPTDINHDLTVDIFDVMLACVAYSSTPSDLNWNCHCDIAEPYGIIDIFDIVTIIGSYGEEYTP